MSWKTTRNKYWEKTDKFKFKSALHVLNAIAEIRSQRTTNEFALMFGLLLVSYGCGKSVLDAVHSLGLCKSCKRFDSKGSKFRINNLIIQKQITKNETIQQ